MRTIGIDPGAKHMGLAVFEDTKLVYSETIHFGNDHIEQTFKFLACWAHTSSVRVVIESFHGGTGGSDQTDTARIIGAVEMYCQFNTYIKLTVQRNITRLSKLDEARAIVRAFNPKATVHAIDAAAHALSRIK